MKNKSADKIFIRGLSVPVIIGVFPNEREAPQTLLIDLEVVADFQQAAASDALQHTIDYAQIRRSILGYTEATKFTLIETLADRLAAHLKQAFHLSWLRLSISKKPFDITDADCVGVCIER